MKHIANHLIQAGYEQGASDLYILPRGENYHLSFRRHHERTLYQELSDDTASKLILFLKYLGGMDISEKRNVQMGGATVMYNDEEHRIRLSSVADFLNRESMVVRFLYPMTRETEYGFIFPEQWEQLKNNIGHNGLYLFSGPTGSGKSTTMHLLVKWLMDERDSQVISIEDPVEMEDERMLQLQVNDKINMDYQELVKACLRHRPDVLVIGEIRDKETAQMAIRAALTGHLVFSTIHSRDKESIWHRFNDLGISEIEYEQSVKGEIYQEILFFNESKKAGVLYDFKIGKEITEWEKSFKEAYESKRIDQEIYDMYGGIFI